MKKALIFLLVLIFSVSSLTVFTGYKLHNEGKNVSYSVVSEYGDRSLLQGVSADIHYSHYERLLWDVHYVPLQKPETKVSFHKIMKQNEASPHYFGLTSVYFSLFDIKDFSEELYNSFQRAKKESAEGKGAVTLEIKMKDHFEYYPFLPEVDLPGINISYVSSPFLDSDREGAYTYAGITKDRAEGFIKALRDYIKIPVYENDTRTTVIERSGSGHMYSSYYENVYEESFQSQVFSDKLYFTVNNRTDPSENNPSVLLDTSLIPGGYGIYSVPYSENDIIYENMTTGMSLSPESTVLNLWGDEEKEELYLLIRENEACYFKVIDIKTMTEKFSERLFDYTDSDWVSFRGFGGFMLFIRNGIEMKLYEDEGNGQYKERLTYKETEDNFIGLEYLLHNSEWASDGERLVLFSVDSFPDNGDGRTNRHEIAVFTKDGLGYYLKEDCSLGEMITWNFSGFITVDEYSVNIQ